MFLRSGFFISLSYLLFACTPAVNEHTALLPGVSSAASVTYDCSYFSEYDSLTECQGGSGANCTSEYQTFPGGGLSLCYAPVDGFEACSVATPTWDWIYSTQWCRLPSGKYKNLRSVINCSSSVCLCTRPQILTQICPDDFACPAFPTTPPNCP